MSGMKEYLSPPVRWFSYHTGISALLSARLNVFRVLKIHGVGTPDLSAAAFESQMRYLQRHFKLLSFAEMVELSQRPRCRPNREIALTFDDGLRSFYTLAYPVLKRLQIPATAFVCPTLVGSSQWAWTYEIRERLRQFTPACWSQFYRHWPDAPLSREKILSWIRLLTLESRETVFAEINRLTPEFSPSPRQRELYEVMNWEEMVNMDPALITLGSHTMTHVSLPGLEPEVLAYELRESRQILETRLNRPVEFFCYPNGCYNATVLKAVAMVYRAAVTSDAGFFQPGDDLHQIRRLSIARSPSRLAWRLYRPSS